MSFTQKYADWFRRILPSPFSNAILLTLFTLILTLLISDKPASDLVIAWQDGLWNSNLLAFAFQMMLMLVLGHTLALSSFFDRLISWLVKPITSTAQAAAIVTFSTILVAFFNWGLGLIFGAILARKLGESFSKKKLPLNYPLIGAAGYVGLMVWHGGISGSALTKVAEAGHLQSIGKNTALPEAIYYGDTVFSTMNMTAFVVLLLIIPFTFYHLGKRVKSDVPEIKSTYIDTAQNWKLEGAEKIDQSTLLSKIIGLLLLGLAGYLAISFDGDKLAPHSAAVKFLDKLSRASKLHIRTSSLELKTANVNNLNGVRYSDKPVSYTNRTLPTKRKM